MEQGPGDRGNREDQRTANSPRVRCFNVCVVRAVDRRLESVSKNADSQAAWRGNVYNQKGERRKSGLLHFAV
ncbi:hypothetical protein Q5P01_022840 [Channa striata]|uniref:Uncharacterized protein n=1 Tax=Channa striata TaxID=64152 RepID=A0AA88S7E7_CHASR|nr:hypothetical protein Q5P01_022840 [Channa striata]